MPDPPHPLDLGPPPDDGPEPLQSYHAPDDIVAKLKRRDIGQHYVAVLAVKNGGDGVPVKASIEVQTTKRRASGDHVPRRLRVHVRDTDDGRHVYLLLHRPPRWWPVEDLGTRLARRRSKDIALDRAPVIDGALHHAGSSWSGVARRFRRWRTTLE